MKNGIAAALAALALLSGCVTQEPDQIVGTTPPPPSGTVWLLDIAADDLTGVLSINAEGQGELPLDLEKGESVSGMVTALDRSQTGDTFIKMALTVRGKLPASPPRYCRYHLGYNGLIPIGEWLLIGSTGDNPEARLVSVRLRPADPSQK